MSFLRPLGLAALAALAGCDMPQPFRHEGPPPELARPQQVRAVTVRPLDESPSALALATAQVKAFTAREIPAAIGGSAPGTLLLHGTIAPQPGLVNLTWQLDNSDHAELATTRQSLTEDQWSAPSPDAFAHLAEQAVMALTATPSEAEPAPAAAKRRTTARVVVPADTPADGAAPLARAMKNALERSGVLVVGDKADYLVEAKVTLTPGKDQQAILAVSWTVKKPDGSSLGTVDQQGPVPAAKLSQLWPGIARDIAEGGAQGIAQVVQSTPHP